MPTNAVKTPKLKETDPGKKGAKGKDTKVKTLGNPLGVKVLGQKGRK
jgi:hypothetical protein